MLGLVDRFGERAPGPCPALRPRADGGYDCNLVLRPKDYARGGAHELRQAAMVLIGAGIGCDEAGDDPDADQKLTAMQQDYLRNRDKIRNAAETLLPARF